MSGGVLVPKGASVDPLARWQTNGQPPLPDWLARVHRHQARAVEQVAEEYARGAQVVMLDAPTGTGKTLIGELVRRELGVSRGLYVCTTKSLQDQMLRDYPFARVLKGRRNYVPTNLTSRERDGYRQGVGGARGIGVTCADCDASPPGVPAEEQACSYCQFVEDCPYTRARQEAISAPVGVLNTSYLLAEANGPGKFRGRELVVMDESDLIERELLGYVEVRLPKRVVEQLGVEVPKKGSHMSTIRTWLGEEVMPGLVDMRRALASRKDLDSRREHGRIDRLVEDVRRVLDREDGWVRDNDEEGGKSPDGLVLKPVTIEDVGGRYLWRHAERWLLMSGTTVSAEGMAEALGVEEAGLKWASVEVPMLFPTENRRVIYLPIASMTRVAQAEGSGATMQAGVQRVLNTHAGVNVLVHSHSYKLAKDIAAGIVDSRPVYTYTNAYDRDGALAKFKAHADDGGAILVAASMDRGVDLPGSMCRVQIVAKMPLPSLGSRQVSERLRQPGGQTWYLSETVRSLLQMCGRAVRGMDDYAVTYILDTHFQKVLKDAKRAGLFPQWWLNALSLGKIREMAEL